ncbi:unnamed protein product [[Actinomadura] parvosata subsp. kistnae]|nr:unnamed protein product [Actinomadura parvosata subsp. kistnae]
MRGTRVRIAGARVGPAHDARLRLPGPARIRASLRGRLVVRLRGHRARLLVRRFRTTGRLGRTPVRLTGLGWRTLGHRTG